MAFGWKVCSYWDWQSPASAIEDLHGVNYKFGEWVFPKGFDDALAVFKTKRYANGFANRLWKWGTPTMVFPCEYIESSQIPYWAENLIKEKKLLKSTTFADAVRIF